VFGFDFGFGKIAAGIRQQNRAWFWALRNGWPYYYVSRRCVCINVCLLITGTGTLRSLRIYLMKSTIL
jgi:hypothetical protein